MSDPVNSRKVETMSGLGIPARDIAQVLRLSVGDLSKRFGDELKDGPIKANSRVAEELYRKATSDGQQSVTAAIFWMKARAGWREVQRQEIGGLDGGPLTIQRIIVSPDGSRSLVNPHPQGREQEALEVITGMPRVIGHD